MSVIFIMFERYIRESYVIVLYYIIMFSKTRKSPTVLLGSHTLVRISVDVGIRSLARLLV